MVTVLCIVAFFAQYKDGIHIAHKGPQIVKASKSMRKNEV